ncbi:response regulator transcription factor [Pediococcus ethanolidurans]|uniref:DNA-binding response regulator n=1 Tax=Pediococcus ethanolidurans TaxID=319653 RepID=A0A0R2K4Z1_9LACO|nr:response regulator transcription factor [Pediococcus ethanolidurans]KRN81181.1 DNA-binding response regulator [Pediococcus ethanolidurans]MBU7554070.1 response regulator transcription factor [Pediococcus ethanolidurans]MBU7564138.1 response regulator transcription factor [Pediococcus ethanolidurans]MCT4398687.1 DNA-binding response regulator [Pediococcus ethanolidurans]MCV3314659.1 response regulator transcription factor [Pediococcus ethanolidurans]
MTDIVKILLIEDDHQLSDSVRDFLVDIGSVKQAFDGEEGEYLATEEPYDLFIVDLMLPLMNGLEIIKNIRKEKIETPVLVLTAKDSLEDKITGFDTGADDYLTKPFHREELIVRVKALLKRSGVYQDDKRLMVDDKMWLNTENRQVTVDGEPLKLVGKEYEILAYLAQNKNIIVSREQIFDRIWGMDSDTTINVVNIYISNLRRKLEKAGRPKLIQTLRNVGFLLEVN